MRSGPVRRLLMRRACQPGGTRVVVSIWLMIAGPCDVRPSERGAIDDRGVNVCAEQADRRVVPDAGHGRRRSGARRGFGISPTTCTRSSFSQICASSLAWP